MKSLLSLLMVSIGFVAWSQTANDGLMMSNKNLCTGFIFSQDQWTNYWEGNRLRDNGNIGTLKTQSLAWMGNYGVSGKFNIIAMLPYVRTEASAGTLKPMQGMQDASLSFKYQVFGIKPDSLTTVKIFAVAFGSTPISDYTPDYLPLSIGLGSRQIGARLSVFAKRKSWYVVSSAGHYFRGQVQLDRQSYYTNGELFLTNRVAMPQVFDWVSGIGRIKNGLEAKLSFTHYRTLGGGDIRRQDMPFVSNRMNMSRIEFLTMYYLPKARRLALRASIARTISGRNVGESTTVLGGLLYTFKF